MISLISAVLAESGDITPSPLRVALSGICGSTSIACWVVLLLPQLIEQWRLKSAEGLSIQFISIWFIGDLLNLLGSLWAGLLLQTIVLAVWFCITDVLMIGSYFYYTKIYPKHHHKHKRVKAHSHLHEESPLIVNPDSRRSSHKSRRNSIDSVILDSKSHSIFQQYILPLLFVIFAGVFGYFMSSSSSGDLPDKDTPDQEMLIGPQILGYCSAILYLTARLPQIYQNHKNKSCEGLSLLFFIFSVFGNFTYALQIFFYRSDWNYIKLYLSWIIGSLGTTVEDFTIFSQFYIYRKHEEEDLESEAIIAANNEVFIEQD